jgi:hypothetical protein
MYSSAHLPQCGNVCLLGEDVDEASEGMGAVPMLGNKFKCGASSAGVLPDRLL